MEKFYFSNFKSFDKEVFARDVFKKEKFVILYNFGQLGYAKKIKEMFDITIEKYDYKFDIMVLKINEDENLSEIQKKLFEIAYYYEYELELWNGNHYLTSIVLKNFKKIYENI